MNTDPAAALRAVFEGRKFDDGRPYIHPFGPITVRAVSGRCVHAVLSGEPNWVSLADDLIRAGGPCEEFRLEGRDLFARMKTPEQRAADDAAFDYDEANPNNMWTHDWPEVAEPKPPKKQRQAQQKRKHGPLYTALADHIEASGAETFDRATLLAEVQEALEKDGREVRRDNLKRTLETQIIGTLLEVVPDTEGQTLRVKE